MRAFLANWLTSEKVKGSDLVAIAPMIATKLSSRQRQRFAGHLGFPGEKTTNLIWERVITAIGGVLVLSAAALAYVTIYPPSAGDKSQSAQMLLTLFTTAMGFLSGLFSPSPIGKARSEQTTNEGGSDD